MKKTKIAFIASSGGHLEEITRLKKIADSCDCFLITEKGDFSAKDFCEKQYIVPQINRKELTFFPKFLWLFAYARKIIQQEKPDYIITTGALIAYPFCLFAKLLNCKIVYIESFARVDSPSMTGKLLYNFADLFIVQWKDMLVKYPKSVLGGGIF